MSVIQNIQEKYAKLMAIIIALALIIFVVMLAFENGGRLFSGSNSTSVGNVNGRSIEYSGFLKKVDQQEKSLEAQYAQYGGAAPPGLQQQAVENAWTQEITQVLQTSELNKLGIKVGKKEIGDILYGANPPEDLKKQFTDSATGAYNAQMAKQQLDQILKSKKGTAEQLAQREQLIAYIDYLENTRLTEKYNSLLTNSINYPKWFIEKQNADNSQLAKLSLVRDYYASNADSTIKISDKEIEEYISKHKDDYPQAESRSIAYFAFRVVPSAADSVFARDKVLGMIPGFDSTKEIKRFLAMQGVQNFYDGYISGSTIQVAAKDSIFKTPVGSVYGPYIDGNSYSIAKLLGVRQQADTVKVRHILVATTKQDPQTGQSYPVRDTATAKKLIDSIQIAIRNGSSFDSLLKLSDDDPYSEQPQAGKFKGGIYDKVTAGRMVAEFNDFILGNPVGSKGVVKTEFGYHYIEILSQKGGSAAYKIAYISKPIEVSSETDNTANSDASLFAGNSTDQKSFDANAEKLKAKGINKNVATDITPMSYQVPSLGVSRTFVKDIFKAKLGEVVFNPNNKVGDNYVVAIVTEINKEGTQPVAKARMQIEPLLRNKKVAEKLKQKVGTPATLEAAAAALGGKPIETVDSLRMSGTQTGSASIVSAEPKVMGAAFNPANKGKVVVIEGANGIYVVRVDNVMATALGNANVAEQRKAQYQQGKQQAMYRTPIIDALKKSATIKDKRSEFF